MHPVQRSRFFYVAPRPEELYAEPAYTMAI